MAFSIIIKYAYDLKVLKSNLRKLVEAMNCKNFAYSKFIILINQFDIIYLNTLCFAF